MSGQQTASACPHPEAVGTRWGDPISEERQSELQGYLDRWAAETDHGERKGPFDRRPHSAGVSLTGADVSWLATQSGRNRLGRVPNLHLEGTNLEWAHLEGSDLSQAHMAGAALERAQLKGANLSYTHLEGADLLGAQLEGANLAPFLGGRV